MEGGHGRCDGDGQGQAQPADEPKSTDASCQRRTPLTIRAASLVDYELRVAHNNALPCSLPLILDVPTQPQKPLDMPVLALSLSRGRIEASSSISPLGSIVFCLDTDCPSSCSHHTGSMRTWRNISFFPPLPLLPLSPRLPTSW
jgi:hypothetical protein